MFLKLYLVTLPVFFAIDMIWLGLIAKNFYKDQIGFLMKTNVNWIAAITFYLIFIAGLVYFVIGPSLEKNSLTNLLISAFLFGLITYATYDLTNLATIKDWPLLVTIVDLIWGSMLSLIVSTIAFLISKKLFI